MRLYNQSSRTPLSVSPPSLTAKPSKLSVSKWAVTSRNTVATSPRRIVPPSQTHRVRFFMPIDQEREPLDELRPANEYTERTPTTPRRQKEASRLPTYGISKSFPKSPKELGIGKTTLRYNSNQLSPPPKHIVLDSVGDDPFRGLARDAGKRNEARVVRDSTPTISTYQTPSNVAPAPSSDISDLGCSQQSTASSAIDDDWFEFSCFGSCNPFQENSGDGRVTSTQNLAGEKERSKVTTTMCVKDTSPHRTAVPVQSRNRYRGDDLGGRVVEPKPSESFVSDYGPKYKRTTKVPKGRNSVPRPLSPSKRDVEPIFPSLCSTGGKERDDLSKYTVMLHSGFAFSCVKRSMERAGVDKTVIDLVTAVNSRS